ncbi:MAG: NUDIX hydrolase [Candidatus Berkelbacteria bacterium]|nr:NUDIX hydrolase [Candidatus Berkelbacteria bacterium]
MKNVVVGIISNEGNPVKYLLVNSTRDFGEFTGFYYPPGGHLDNGEDEKTALIREIKEELNLDVTPVEKLAETGSDLPDQITHWWRCDVVGEAKIQTDKDEIGEVKWFSRDEIIKSNVVWPASKKFFEEFVY